MIRCVFIVLLSASGYSVADTGGVTLDDSTNTVNLRGFADVFVDHDEHEDFPSIVELPSSRFTANQRNSFVVPFSAESIWIRFALSTTALPATAVTWWNLRIRGSPASVEVFFPHVDGSYRTTSASATTGGFAHKNRPRRESPMIPVYPDRARSVYYIHVVPGLSRTISGTLESPRGFQANTTLRGTVGGALMGIALFMIVYSLILYRYTQDLQRLWFTAVVASLLFTELSMSSVWTDAFPTQFTPLLLIPLSIALSLFFFTRYAFQCLFPRAPARTSVGWFLALAVLPAAVITPLVLGYISSLSGILMAAALLVSAAILAVAVHRVFRRDSEGRLFLLAWSPALIVVSAVAVQSLGVTLPWYIDTRLLFVAMTIGIVLTSMNTGYLYVMTERARRRAIDDKVRLEQSNARLQTFAASARAMAAENERDRIAREVHDTVGYALTTIGAQVSAVSHIYGRHEDEVASRLQRIDTMMRVAMRDVRNAVHQLRDEAPLRDSAARIQELCAAFTHATGAQVDLSIAGDLEGLNGGNADALFHFIQEGLTNSWRHGDAGRIRIRVSCGGDNGNLVVALRDFGSGASHYEEGGGLRGIRERVEAVDGVFNRHASPGAGFLLWASFPVARGCPGE